MFSSDMRALIEKRFGAEEVGRVDNVNDIRRQIRSKFSEIRELNERLRKLEESPKKASATTLAESVTTRCPHLRLCGMGAPSPNDLSGFSVGFKVEAPMAPFFVFNERGTALMSTLPNNHFGLTVVGNAVAFMTSETGGWRCAQRDVVDGSGEVTEKYRGKIVVNQSYGHPHCRFTPDSGVNFIANVEQMCFGNNNVNSLISSMSSPSDIVPVMVALNSWLMDVNVSSPWHSRVSPVFLETSYLHAAVMPWCQTAAPKVKTFVSSPAYADFVNAARSACAGKMQEMRGEVSRLLSGIPGPGGELARRHADTLAECEYSGSDTPNALLSVGAHQLLGAILVLGSPARWDGAILENAASAMMATLGPSWTSQAGSYATVYRSERALRNSLVKYFADWEVMKSGNYY